MPGDQAASPIIVVTTSGIRTVVVPDVAHLMRQHAFELLAVHQLQQPVVTVTADGWDRALWRRR